VILSSENYFSPEANLAYFSVSQIKAFLDCEERALAELNGSYVRPKSKSLLVGGYVDAHFSNELPLFKAQNPEIFTKTGELRSEFRQAENIIARIESDALAMRMMNGDRQHILTGEINGEPFKAKLDCLLDEKNVRRIADEYPAMDELLFAEGAIVDLKIMRDFEPVYKDGAGKQNFIEAWGYDLQLAVYQHLVKQKTGKQLPCYLLASTKEETPNLDLFRIPQQLMDACMEILTDKLPRISAVKDGAEEPDRCGKCAWCKETKVLTGATWLEEWA